VNGDEVGAALEEHAEGLFNAMLREHVDRAGRLVQQQNPGSAGIVRDKQTKCRWPSEIRSPDFPGPPIDPQRSNAATTNPSRAVSARKNRGDTPRL